MKTTQKISAILMLAFMPLLFASCNDSIGGNEPAYPSSDPHGGHDGGGNNGNNGGGGYLFASVPIYPSTSEPGFVAYFEPTLSGGQANQLDLVPITVDFGNGASYVKAYGYYGLRNSIIQKMGAIQVAGTNQQVWVVIEVIDFYTYSIVYGFEQHYSQYHITGIDGVYMPRQDNGGTRKLVKVGLN